MVSEQIIIQRIEELGYKVVKYGSGGKMWKVTKKSKGMYGDEQYVSDSIVDIYNKVKDKK